MRADSLEFEKIAPYVSNLDRDVFALFGLPEEVMAVLFAYYSRSRNHLRENLLQLVEDDDLDIVRPGDGAIPTATGGLHLASEKARAFHEKWVVGYGHSSVAEHAVVHLALENVSIVASKILEDMRLGAFTEKSTRYVVFDTQSFVDLPHLPEPLQAVYRTSNEQLFRTYLELIPRADEAVRRRVPRGPTQTERGYNTAVRATTCDLLRGLLPAGTRTNLGLTANARALEALIGKMLSSPLPEASSLAEQMLREARVVVPTLLKHAGASSYRQSFGPAIGKLAVANGIQFAPADPIAGEGPTTPGGPPRIHPAGVRLVDFDQLALAKIARALVYEWAPGDATLLFAECESQMAVFVRGALEGRGRFDAVPRAFEAAQLTMELTLDFGAYRDMQRHRMLSPYPRRLSCSLGAAVPQELTDMGLGGPYRTALDRAAEAVAAIEKDFPCEAQYAVPLAYLMQTLWVCNFRELFHVIELRSGRQGHPSYRRIAQDMYRAASEAFPWLKGLVRVDLESYPLTRSG